MKPDAAVHAKNQAAIDRGRAEIESRRIVHGQLNSHGQPNAADQQNPAYFPGADNRSSVLPGQPSKGPYNQKPGFSGISGSQIEPEGSKGRFGGFMKKMKDGPMNSQRPPNADGTSHAVNG